MTIERMTETDDDAKADWLVTCDKPRCKGALDSFNNTFNETVALIKERGWGIRKVFSTWQHHCPEHK